MGTLSTARGVVGFDWFGPDDAPPLVLIQGYSAQRLGWRPGFCEALADAGFRVLRYDNRDVGESQHYPGASYALSDLADDTAALLDALELDTVHVVGQSMGGMIAQLVATQHPSRVRSLGLLYTAANLRHFIGAELLTGRTEEEPPTTRDDFIAAYVRDEASCSSPAYRQDTEWLAELGAQMWDRGVDRSGAQRQFAAILAQADRSTEAAGIRVPTVIIAGDGDQLIDSAASVELHEQIAASELSIFEGMGHELPKPLWTQIIALLAGNAHRA